MAKSKKLYSKEYIQSKATEMAKAAGLEGISLVGVPNDLTEKEYQEYMNKVKQTIAKSVHKMKNIKDEKTETVALNKRQLCAAIQFVKMWYAPYLDGLDPDSEEASDAFKFVNSCERTNKMVWAAMGDYEINVPFKVPDISDDELFEE